MGQRAAALELKLLIDEAMGRARVARRARERLDQWLLENPEHHSEYILHNIGPARRRWLEAYEGDANGRTGRSIG